MKEGRIAAPCSFLQCDTPGEQPWGWERCLWMAKLYMWNNVQAAALPCGLLCQGDHARHHLTPLALVPLWRRDGTCCLCGVAGWLHVVGGQCLPTSECGCLVACLYSQLTWEAALGRGLTTVSPEKLMFALQECPAGQPRLLESLFASLTQSIQWRHIVPLAARILWRSCWSRCPRDDRAVPLQPPQHFQR